MAVATRGYPAAPEVGTVIDGLAAAAVPRTLVFHAGAWMDGRRVLTLVGWRRI